MKELIEQLKKEEGTMQDLINFNKNFYKNLITLPLQKCIECAHHKGMDESFIRCGHIKEFNIMVISQPSHYNEGFKNGEMIVRCPKEVT